MLKFFVLALHVFQFFVLDISIFMMPCFYGNLFMKKIKYRNNNFNSQVYSINYKFDSVSPAGKCCGTALDLIKRYNELAKEAQSNGNYVEAEVFRQYAEHYRKIVTEINERKNLRFTNKETEQSSENVAVKDNQQLQEEVEVKEEENVDKAEEKSTLVETKPKTSKKSFTVIDVTKEAPKTKRTLKPRAKKNNDEETVANQ